MIRSDRVDYFGAESGVALNAGPVVGDGDGPPIGCLSNSEPIGPSRTSISSKSTSIARVNSVDSLGFEIVGVVDCVASKTEY